MAKSIVLYGVFLGAVVCFCAYFACSDISSYQSSAVSNQPLSVLNEKPPVVILSGAERSRKISRDVRYEALVDRFGPSVVGDQLSATYLRNRSAEEDVIRAQIKQIYSAEIGVREATGKNDGKRVEEYLAVTKLGKGYAWCASFVSWGAPVKGL